MKLLVLILVLMNIAVWYAPEWMPSSEGAVAEGVLPRVLSLKVEPETLGESVCVRLTLGDFRTRAQARRVAEGFSVSPGVVETQREIAPLHWVLIPPQPPEDARAQFRELVRQGVESYIVSGGEYRNAISLGLFESEQAARSVLAEKKQSNPNVVLAKFPRNRLGYALVFEVESTSEDEWVQAVEAETGHEFDFVESNACEGVASPEKNP
ncbi:hypothetical protein KUV59_15500 [Marinobacter daepoensis]|nr:hypothetical protein [Marinobacter daepoensis]